MVRQDEQPLPYPSRSYPSPGGSQGRLKVFLGAAPGVGKTFRMLDEAR